MKLAAFFKKLLFGSESYKAFKPNPFYQKQLKNLKAIWNNQTYNDFGIERIFRLFLQLTAFIIPSSFIRQISGRGNFLIRKVSIELWGIMKIAFYITILKFDHTRSFATLIVAIVFSIDTLHFLLGRIFLNDVFRQAISYKRSLIMTFLNYIEICLCFAFLYAYMDHTSSPNIQTFNKTTDITNVEAIYFSFVTSATIGYGDITAKDPSVMKIVIGQILISLLLVVVIINNVTNKLEDDTFYNKK